jgi:hypothetical protein
MHSDSGQFALVSRRLTRFDQTMRISHPPPCSDARASSSRFLQRRGGYLEGADFGGHDAMWFPRTGSSVAVITSLS